MKPQLGSAETNTTADIEEILRAKLDVIGGAGLSEATKPLPTQSVRESSGTHVIVHAKSASNQEENNELPGFDST